MLLHINGKLTIVGQEMKQTDLCMWYPLFQTQWDKCDQQKSQNL